MCIIIIISLNCGIIYLLEYSLSDCETTHSINNKRNHFKKIMQSYRSDIFEKYSVFKRCELQLLELYIHDVLFGCF